jgi:predicted nuclease with TOPRIM domain
MTTLQKTVVGATLVAAIGTGVYEAHQSSNLRTQVQSLVRQQAPLTERIEQLSRERNEVGRQLVALRDENERLNRNTGELVKLRGEVARLRANAEELAELKAAAKDPFVDTALDWKAKNGTFGPISFQKFDEEKALAPYVRALDRAKEAFSAANNGQQPADPSQLASYLRTPEEQSALQKVLQARKPATK